MNAPGSGVASGRVSERVQPRRRPLDGIALPVAVLLVWAGVVTLSLLLGRTGVPTPPTCVFRAATGWACPTCGSTRAGLALLSMRPGEALALNPLMTVLLVAGPLTAVWRLVRGRAFGLSGSQWTVAAIALAGAVVANWVYVLSAGV